VRIRRLFVLLVAQLQLALHFMISPPCHAERTPKERSDRGGVEAPQDVSSAMSTQGVLLKDPFLFPVLTSPASKFNLTALPFGLG